MSAFVGYRRKIVRAVTAHFGGDVGNGDLVESVLGPEAQGNGLDLFSRDERPGARGCLRCRGVGHGNTLVARDIYVIE